MAKLDSNAAWKEATGLVAANRDMFLVLAGVFFLLPSLALSVFMGEPEMTPGMGREQMMAALSAFYTDAWWLIALSSVLQVVGILSILTLMRDRSRPTVSEAIRAGLGGLLPYLAAQILFVLALSLVGGLTIGLAAVAAPALAAVVAIVWFAFAVYAAMRLILVAPIVAVEGQRNPIAALRRSWTLTQGNFWRIIGFVVLAMILFLVVLGVIMLLVGLVLAIVSSGETQRVLAAVVSSTLTALAVLYFIGILAAIHRQLAGPGKESLDETFA
ncbi:MAG TPA: glycerophosphoryl diester phosphodiesterase membrane domain-containing protein [Novosphingobium sp.]|nr:glycerophosphoryl diester phosphodiesterase membrane domain-containing protein [Novosphingobium sp.]